MPHETAAISSSSCQGQGSVRGLQVLHMFCAHHTTMHQFTVSLYSKAHMKDTCVSWCDLTPALLAEWSFMHYCNNTGVKQILKQESAQEADSGEENYPTGLAGTWTQDISITGLSFYHWTIPTPSGTPPSLVFLPESIQQYLRGWGSLLVANFGSSWNTGNLRDDSSCLSKGLMLIHLSFAIIVSFIVCNIHQHSETDITTDDLDWSKRDYSNHLIN